MSNRFQGKIKFAYFRIKSANDIWQKNKNDNYIVTMSLIIMTVLKNNVLHMERVVI